MTDWSSGAKALLLFQLSSLHGVDEETNGKRAALIAQIAALDNQERLIELSLSPEERAAKAAKRAAKVAADTVFEKRKEKIKKRAVELTDKLISRKIGFKISTLIWVLFSLSFILPFVKLFAQTIVYRLPERVQVPWWVIDLLSVPFFNLFFNLFVIPFLMMFLYYACWDETCWNLWAPTIERETEGVDTKHLDAFFANQDMNCPESSCEDLSWNPLTGQWNKGFANLQEYVKQNGSARVPRGFKNKDGFRLGVWVSNQRLNKGSLSVERRSLLEASCEDWSWGASNKPTK